MYDQVVKCQRAGLCLSEHFLIIPFGLNYYSDLLLQPLFSDSIYDHSLDINFCSCNSSPLFYDLSLDRHSATVRGM